MESFKIRSDQTHSGRNILESYRVSVISFKRRMLIKSRLAVVHECLVSRNARKAMGTTGVAPWETLKS